MTVKYATSALVGIVLVLAAFTVDQSEFMGEAVAVGMTIIGMPMVFLGAMGFFDNFGHRNRRQGDREDT